ncbi:MAG: hypothetical protein HOG90_02500 [Betaproteobacteria bacterium]|jgi:hypothetical protein|nr:hypothetical protein [Betaproteobacteria bacterium]
MASSLNIRRADSDFEAIEAATNECFPMLKLYDGWGGHLRTLLHISSRRNLEPSKPLETLDG